MPRMPAVRRSWPGREPLSLRDTGPAAILGALDDAIVAASDPVSVVNIGNFHTIAALLEGRRIRGLFEHHTGELSRPKLEQYLDALAIGALSNDEAFADMGHGALELGLNARSPKRLAVTGPRPGLLDDSRLLPHLAVPHGDMMLAGCLLLPPATAARLPDFSPVVEDLLGAPAPQP